jgi:thiosulfate/3-mercaptopyruvate sulfurtransferase
LAVVLLSATWLASPATGQAQRGDLLVPVGWVAERLNDPNLVLLHVGPEEDYEEGHIPGAHFLEFREASHPDSHQEGNLILELPEPEAFQEALRSWGVTRESNIVIYWGSEWVTPTTRVVFTLDWAGLGEQTRVLDGGLGAWTAAGRSTTSEVPEPGHGDVVIHPRDLVVGAAWVQEHAMAPGYQVVDGRARAFFDGVRPDRDKEGHIPGAGSVPWTELIDESLMLKDQASLREIFSAAGVEPGDTVVAYCHIGQYATMVLFAARILGHEVRLYDGAFQDWAARDLPVTTESGNRE